MVTFKISLVENQCLRSEAAVRRYSSQVGALKSYAIFTEKHLRRILFIVKFQSFRPATLLKRNSNLRCFPVSIAKFLRTAFFIEHLRWLLLPFTTTFRNYYWKDRLVILFTLTHPSKRLNTCFELDIRKGRYQGLWNPFKIYNKDIRKEIVKIKASQ